MVHAGPGKRVVLERQQGKCDISEVVNDGVIPGHGLTETSQVTASVELEALVTTLSRFDGATQDLVPQVFHDMAEKSIYSYDIFKTHARMKFRDGMKRLRDAGIELTPTAWWDHGTNRKDIMRQTSVVVFCSMQTIYQVLAAANILGRFTSASGGITVVNFPIGGQPSLCLGQGTMARGNLRWGVVTEDETQHGYNTQIIESGSKKTLQSSYTFK